ncbi:hypothetical protein AB0B94_10890 [Micromonospora sp. NPDC048986]|uniref:hypothetical protein n=1 Tax=Micromonospora sp. NPDC048986 TaxID=3155644 RepID=UPI0033C3BF55
MTKHLSHSLVVGIGLKLAHRPVSSAGRDGGGLDRQALRVGEAGCCDPRWILSLLSDRPREPGSIEGQVPVSEVPQAGSSLVGHPDEQGAAYGGSFEQEAWERARHSGVVAGGAELLGATNLGGQLLRCVGRRAALAVLDFDQGGPDGWHTLGCALTGRVA